MFQLGVQLALFILIKEANIKLMSSNNCLLCQQTNEQVKILIFGLKKKLLSLFNNYSPVFKQNTLKEDKKNQSFHQLIKLVFSTKQFIKIDAFNCQHEKIFRYLKRKLKCDSQTFSLVCQQLCFKLAQRNYQLEIVSNQIKSISDRAEVSFQTKNKIKDKKSKNNETSIKCEEICSFSDFQNNKITEKDHIKVQQNQNNKSKQIAQQIQTGQNNQQPKFNYVFPYGYYYSF